MNRIITEPLRQVRQADNFEKGYAFEKYVTELFNANSFRIVKWRKSEKITDHSFLFDHSNPDLELIFFGAKKYRFAVECKWRKEFIAGKINWATNHQISSYEAFQNQNRIPVFIAIGIGGLPSNPEKLFVTPLYNINIHTEVLESELILYKRRPTHRFFYDTVQLRLW